jgi:hypothetical protein
MKTKLVTAYYPHSVGEPIWGKNGRERWYKYSLASICGTDVPVFCYTSGEALKELEAYREERNLTNLTLIDYDITQGPFHERIYNTRIKHWELYNNKEHPFYYMSFSIYWNKWHFLKLQYEPDTYIYWIDSGLSTEGVFPRRVNDYSHEEDFLTAPNGVNEFKHYSFSKIFNPDLLPRINKYAGNKILNLCRRGSTDNDFGTMQDKLGVPVRDQIYSDDLFPVASLFGGNTPLLLDYIEKIHSVMEDILARGDYLCTEQEIMGYVHTFNRDLFTDWIFNDFYHEDWLIMVHGEKVKYRDLLPNNIAFSEFWINTPTP